MKTNNNIVSSFFKRALLSIVFISLFSSISIFYFQQYNFYTSLVFEIKTNIDIFLFKHGDFSDKEIIKKTALPFMKEHDFVVIDMYDKNKNKFLTIHSNENKFKEKLKLLQEYDSIPHEFSQSKNTSYQYFELSNKYHFLQIFYPVYKSELFLGYVKSIVYIEPIIIQRFKKGILATMLIVILTIVTFSLLIFPLIYFAYKRLNEHRIELLTSNIMTIYTLGNAIALRDSDTNDHNYRVTLYAIKFAQKIQLDNKSMKKLIKGAFLHDVGKIGISDTILLKNGSLNQDELKVMRSHVDKGVALVNGTPWLEEAKDVILHHHERCDGSGYPNKKTKDEIPKVARIFILADVFDALTSKRPYKEKLSYEESIRILKDGHNKHFDGELLGQFIEISNELYTEIHLKSKEALKEELFNMIKKYFLN